MNCTSVSSVSLQSLDRNNLQIDLLKIKNFIFVFLRGILAIAWSMADPELLLSCGKDAKILCSSPNTGEVWGGNIFQTWSDCNI